MLKGYQDKFNIVKNETLDFITYGPKNFKSDKWNLLLMTLNYQGQLIDLSGAYNTKIFNEKAGVWQCLSENLSLVTIQNVFGLQLPVIPKNKLIAYKKILSRKEDLSDVSEMEKNLFTIRKAIRQDVPQIVQLLARDPLGKSREDYHEPLPENYYKAFEEIEADKNNFLVVVVDDEKIIGTLQLTVIPYLTYKGSKRGLIEGVRIDETYRGKGIGKQLIEWAIGTSRELGCHLVQLTTDKKRPGAFEFYKKLGFIDSHEGLKFYLNEK